MKPERAGIHCLRDPTKGRVEARSHTEKNDRNDLAEETVTGSNVGKTSDFHELNKAAV